MLDLRQFQRRFLSRALHPSIRTAALSIPRGNGKSALAGHILTRCLSPGDPFNVPGAEYLLCAASIEQARIVHRFTRQDIEPRGGFRFIDSTTRLGITHLESNTRLRILSSKAKTAFGVVGVPLMVCDEPGSWEVVGGQLMHDAIETAQGKPGSSLRVVYIGTLAPATGGWWHDLIADGSHGSTYVMSLQGDRRKWDQWGEIRRCNPLMSTFAESRAVLLEERDKARRDTRLKARFLSYRLNLPTADESAVLLTVEDWKRVLSRPVPERVGRPIVSVDLGGGRAWSAAVGIWKSGRVEAAAIAPGLPAVSDQETRDRVPRGTYQRLVDDGTLHLAEGLRVPKPAQLCDLVRELWGVPAVIVCDRFRLGELQDAANGCHVAPRISRWSEASEDIRALRSLAADGPLACEVRSRGLLTASLAVAMVKNDDQGNTRLAKKGTANCSRDDAAAALVLAAGAVSRAFPRRRWRYAGAA